MNLEFFEAARIELVDAASYYEAKEKGLGIRFRNEIAHVCLSIRTQSLLWREREEGYRRVKCPVFPYLVAYLIEKRHDLHRGRITRPSAS